MVTYRLFQATIGHWGNERLIPGILQPVPSSARYAIRDGSEITFWPDHVSAANYHAVATGSGGDVIKIHRSRRIKAQRGFITQLGVVSAPDPTSRLHNGVVSPNWGTYEGSQGVHDGSRGRVARW